MGTLRSVEISVASTLRIPRPCGAPRTVDNVFAPGGGGVFQRRGAPRTRAP